MSQKRAALAKEHPAFYPKAFRQLVFFVLVLWVMVLTLLGIILYQHLYRPEPQYFVTTSDGRLVEIHPNH